MMENQAKGLRKGILGVYILSFELYKFIRNCDPAPRITPCVNAFYDKKYGTEYDKKFQKFADRIITNFNGAKDLQKKTGCTKPCEETRYNINEFRKLDLKYMAEPVIQEFLKEKNATESALSILFNHQKMVEITQYEEEVEYNANKLIGDSGGIIGIFVGLSFWSIYVDFIGPIIEWFEYKFSK